VSLFLLDTDHLTLYQMGHPQLLQNVARHLTHQLAMSSHASLIRQRLNVGSNDLKIAATALEQNATVVTRNLRDFGRVPGLTCEDWTV